MKERDSEWVEFDVSEGMIRAVKEFFKKKSINKEEIAKKLECLPFCGFGKNTLDEFFDNKYSPNVTYKVFTNIMTILNLDIEIKLLKGKDENCS